MTESPSQNAFAATSRRAVSLVPLDADGLQSWRRAAAAAPRRWTAAVDFQARPGTHCLVPDSKGALGCVLLGVADNPEADGGAHDPWAWADAASHLPSATYRISPREGALASAGASAAALGWGLAAYRYDRFKSRPKAKGKAEGGSGPRLVWPENCDRQAVGRALDATFHVRDLINAPASHLGPLELAKEARALGRLFKASVRVISGDALLKAGYPAIHAVGRAAAQPPCLIDLVWGRPGDPKVTLCGKGVCFDTGGLDIKPAAGMKLMKKDMGGAAHVLGLARMIMAAGLRVRLRVLIPAVENSIAGNAMRPLDVVETRKGTTIEIGNTDAEGRVVLADALEEASRERPDLILDFATLTGAARVALGTELPALFANDDALAQSFQDQGAALRDPVWRLPLWPGYRRHVTGQIADLTNAPESGFGGAITAALFLQDFVAPGIPWAHLDLMAWNTASRPGRPQGGEAMGLRAAFALIEQRFAR